MKEDSIQSFISELRKVVTDAEALLQADGTEIGDELHAVRQKLSRSMEEVGHTIQRLQTQIRSQAGQVAHSAGQYVHENPWTSVGVAGVAGLLVGLILRRR